MENDLSLNKKWSKCTVPFNYQVHESAIDFSLCNKDLVAHVEDNDRLWAGQAIKCITVVVMDHNTKVVFGHYLFHQPVGTVSLKTIVGSIKGDVVGVSPTIADTYTQHRYYIFKINQKSSDSSIVKQSK